VIGQFHDEVIAEVTDRDHTTKTLKAAIKEVNADLGMNVELDVDVQFGSTYADIH
jgi:DNA polymerase I-like protein with 3'-5' exonuclease and polymerase domains